MLASIRACRYDGSVRSIATSEGPSLERELRRALAQFPEVTAAWLFGSRARGDAREDSDMDIAILLAAGTDSHDPTLLGALAAALETAAGGLVIDLVVLDLSRQGPVFCHRVLTEGTLLHDADRARRVDFESTTYSRYFDHRPTWDIAAARSVRGFRRWLRARR